MSSSSMNMRALTRWSAISLTVTVPTPWKGEPSRRIAHPLLCRPALEDARVDRIEARLVDREPAQRTIRRDHRPGSVRPHVTIGRQPKAINRNGFDLADAGNRGKPSVEPCAVRLHLDEEARAKHLPGKV